MGIVSGGGGGGAASLAAVLAVGSDAGGSGITGLSEIQGASHSTLNVHGNDADAAGVTGTTVDIAGQDATGAGAGGAVDIAAGSAAGRGGNVSLSGGNTAGAGSLPTFQLIGANGAANGGVVFSVNFLPPDAIVSASQFALWLDDTVGATKLMVKGADSGGTIRTAAIALA